MTTRIGLVGAGFIGSRHLDSLSTRDDVRVVAVAAAAAGNGVVDLAEPAEAMA